MIHKYFFQEVLSDNENKPFYEKSSGDEDDNAKAYSKPTYTLDADHRLLLRQTKPLLQSRNASVVMCVAQLYHHIAPRNDVNSVAKALIRLLRSHSEVQSVVLTCIASMTLNRKHIFESHLKSFFVRTSDATHIKLLKLDILTNLATEASIPVILREFQTYISSIPVAVLCLRASQGATALSESLTCGIRSDEPRMRKHCFRTTENVSRRNA